eukprot:gb/GECH01013862.1/.p1 GENE.gb/GECH01013862.1/~~gb/GECH01013862.1/.p1  ORF type:complete len:606 (+),score=81.08 gb/GECH01013862.1/:1-1818(+)
MSETPTHSDFSSGAEDDESRFPSSIMGQRDFSSSINNNYPDLSQYHDTTEEEAKTHLLSSGPAATGQQYHSAEDHEHLNQRLTSSSKTGDGTEALHDGDGDEDTKTNDEEGSVEIHREHNKGYGVFVGYCFTVNYILGVGVLGIPYAFYQAGLALGPIVLLVLSFLAAIALSWVLETMARAEGIERDSPEFKIADDRKFEVNQLCRMFLGRFWGGLYEVFVGLYLYGALWSYSTVFAESMALNVPLPVGPSDNLWYTCNVYQNGSGSCTAAYLIYIGIFALIVIPMTCLDLREQKPVQVIMALFRFFAMGLMVLTITVSIFTDPYSLYSPKDQPKDFSKGSAPYTGDNSAFSLTGFAPVLPVLVYSQIMHHSAPGLSEPVTKKKRVGHMFYSVFITTFFGYSLLGLVLTLYYGKNISPTCSLNFSYYRGGAAFGESKPWWAYIIQYIIVLFPAIDVCSAFPLNGVTLGNNLLAGFIGNPETREKRWIRVLFRLLASIPPLIGASRVRQLDTILKYVGLSGFIIAFIYPAFLNMASSKKARQRFERFKTMYTTYFTRSVFCWIVIVITSLAVLFCLTSFLMCTICKHVSSKACTDHIMPNMGCSEK